MNVQIREMKLKDLISVMDIERKIFKSPWSEAMFLKEIKDQYSYVLENTEEIIGYICGWKVLDEFTITNIALKPEFRRKGFGKKMAEFIIARADKAKCKEIFLEVRESNEAAIKLYEKLEFSKIGLRKNYYPDPKENAVVMRKKCPRNTLKNAKES